MSPTFSNKWRADASVIAGLLLVIAPYHVSGQARSVESTSNIECLERLEMPNYPQLPRTARIQATQTVKVLLSDQATVQNVESSIQGKSTGTEKDKSLNAFAPPNNFWIRAGPFYVQPEVSVR